MTRTSLAAAILCTLLGCTARDEDLHKKFSSGALHNDQLEDVRRLDSQGDIEILGTESDRRKIKIVVRKSTLEQAARQYAGLEAAVESFYLARTSPYIGMVSREISCPKEFQPEMLSGQGRFFHQGLLAYTNDRMNTGVCHKSQLAYAALLSVFFCGDKSYEIHIYEKHLSFENLRSVFAGFQCLAS